MTDTPPRPSFSPIGIGAESHAPFAVLPRPAVLFARRAARFVARAEGELAPYLTFLAAIAAAQAASLRPIDPIQADAAARAAEHAMPPIDRIGLKHDQALLATVRHFLAVAADIAMPEAAAEARAGLLADEPRLLQRIADALEDAVPMDAVADFVFAAAGVQVHLAGLAAGLAADILVPVGDGACPCCGGPPVASVVVERAGAYGARYAVCAACATEWNVVRVKCTLCGSTEGIGYHELEGAKNGVQAETCDHCGLYAKIFAQAENPQLDPVADDVASLGLDIKMVDSAWKRGAVNAFLAGY